MIPLLFLNPRWIRQNPIETVLIAVIFTCIGIAIFDKWGKGKD